MKVTAFLIIFLLFSFRTGHASTYPDSLRTLIRHSEDPPEKLRLLLDLSDYLRMRKNDSTLVLAQQAEALAMELEDYESALAATATRALFYHSIGDAENAKTILLTALRNANAWAVSDMIPVLQNNLALIYRREGQRDSAFYYWSEAEKYYEAQVDLPYEVWRIYLGMGNLYWERNDLENAERYLRKAYDLTADRNKAVDFGFVLFQIADFYFSTDQFAQLAEMKTIWDERQAKRRTARELMELPEHTSLLYLFGEIKPDIIPRLERAAAFYRQSGKLFNEAWTLENLGFYLHREGQYERAIDILEGVLPVYREANRTVRAGTVQYELYKLYKATGQVENALQNLEEYTTLKDSLRSEEIENNLADLQVQYQTEKQEQQLRIQELELEQKTQQLNVFLIATIVLAILAFTIFFGYRQRLQTNRQLSAQASEIQAQKIRQLEQDNQLLSLNAMIEGQESERMRIAQDLHDGIGGLLTTVKAHFYAIQEQVDKLQQLNIYQRTNELIDEACVEVRRISQNMMPRALQLLGLQGAIEDLATQLRQKGMNCELEIIGLSDDLGRPRKVMLFRIIQELCNNISKHAGASQVFIQLLQHGQEISLIVEDDGRGFNYQAIAGKTPSLGLKNIASRVKFLKGSWDVDSVPGEGTTVMIRIPLD
ncbi:tetratricopeptide repeat-containing sensor histidine kinase [Flavilitoribacter nigricans]|uniref:histidine kinase n=1 Tax=Flavilitoribacter nigricans (strain ATCC 23147 / DSM 23189 / NBRC 102662 / NCIMB 1420 / SS-2) TaxID=1122177 RepID=A0A2D0N8J2_FLAN2|nr:tetratricopeptide repeat-containing sensor histidine kinase [Flavilitoribacter nigricans]PHN04797.1 hypothetical protein CRP01_20000 [Flavilitoribacter nigricans DSM 23189 = NBRC 102662]